MSAARGLLIDSTMFRHAALPLLLSSLLSFGSGCTLVGLGVGAAIDSALPGPYESRSPGQLLQIKPRDRAVFWLGNGRRVEGRYLGSFGPTARDPETYLIVDDASPPSIVRSSDVRGVGVEITGKGWLYGGIIGLSIDASLAIVALVAVHNMRIDLRSDDRDGFFY